MSRYELQMAPGHSWLEDELGEGLGAGLGDELESVTDDMLDESLFDEAAVHEDGYADAVKVVDPVKPVDPVRPVDAVRPVDPVKPVDPDKPVTPVRQGGGAGAASAYQTVQQNAERHLIEQHAPLVKRIAHHLLMRMPASVQLDDLIQSGMIGLLEAARKYDVSKGASFETYAGIRIRGAMRDEVRRGDWAPRSVYRKSREVAEAVKAVESRTGTDARDHEVAEQLGVDLATYYTILQDASGSRLFSYDDLNDGGEEIATPGSRSEGNGPAQALQDDRFRSHLAEAIDELPEREKLVLALYYDEELNLKEIGEILGVSESRVSQIHSQAALRLRARLQDWR